MDQMPSTAPWVEFKKVGMEDRQRTMETGKYTEKDVNYAVITPPGTKDCVEKEAEAWLADIRVQAAAGRFPPAWVDGFNRMYKEWLETGEISVEGTPIKNWSLLSPAQVNNITGLKVRTVEQLAQADEEVIRKLGMGGRQLVEKAKAFVSQASGGQLIEENEGLKVRVAELERTLLDLQQANDRLQAQVDLLSEMRTREPNVQEVDPPAKSGDVKAEDILTDEKPAAPAPALKK